MDDFKRSRRIVKRPHAVDGFVPSRQSAGFDARNHFTAGHQPAAAPQHVAHYAQAGGFASAQHPVGLGADTKAPIDEPGGRRARRKRNRVKSKAKRSVFKRVLRGAFVMLILSVILIGGYAGYGFIKARQVFKGGGGAAALEKNVDPVKLKGEGDGRINVTLFGIGGEGHDGAYLTDTIMIVSIDPVQNEAAMLSIPRDLWVKQDSGGYTKINAIYAYERERVLARTKDKDAANKAAAAATQKVLTNVTGIPMNYFVTVDFNGFEKAVDTIGGLDLTVSEQLAVTETLWDHATRKNYYLNVKPGGPQHFDGKRALYYSRSRHTSARGDFDRAERQRQVIMAFKDKVQAAGTYANPVKVTQLLSAFGDHVRTDLSINELMRLYDVGKGINPDKIVSVGLADKPQQLVRTDNIDGLSVVVPSAGVGNYDDIRAFVRNSLKDAFIKNENASILVLNGTAVDGLAGRKSSELKSFGYNVVGAASAPTKSYTKTVIVDMRNGAKKYTRNYLEKRFGVSAVGSSPDPAIVPGNADFVIILGTDAAAATN